MMKGNLRVGGDFGDAHSFVDVVDPRTHPSGPPPGPLMRRFFGEHECATSLGRAGGQIVQGRDDSDSGHLGPVDLCYGAP